MAEPISRFRQRYAGIELKISEFGGLTVQQAVSNGELDLAMTALPVDEASGLTTLSLFSHPLCVLTPRTAQWEGLRSLSPQALAAIRAGEGPKGDVIAAARIAGARS